MTDTRKDKRAPLSLKVRFKSATVDEFIEQYATDISRGGIYIKSKQPMPIGTLLKFEFQLKDESKLIQGVGRVVWKREAGEGATDANPSGMGIKFIKMDPESKALVEQIVAGRGDAPGQYEAGGGAAVTAGDDEAAPATATATAAPAGDGKRPVRSQKATMQFFPSTTPQNELPPPEDRTQVRHASEFLASALSSAGADEATAGEADKSADEARKRTEEIERQREEQQRKAREEEASKARAEKDRQEREKAEAARAEEEKAAEKADADRRAKEAAATVRAEAKDKPASDEKKAAAASAAAAPSEKKAAPAEKRPAPAEKKSEARPAAVVERPPAPEAPPSNMVPIFATVAVIVLVGGWFMFGRGGATETPDTDLPPPPPEAVAVDDPPVADPVVEDTPPAVDPTVEPEVVAVPDEPPAPTFDVAIETTPPGASIFVDGAPSGTSPATVSVTEGAHAIEARLAGYRTGTGEATGAEHARPVRITLAALPYAITVTTTPPGARVRIGARTITSPGRAEIPRPTAALTAIATLAGYQESRTTVAPTEFVAGDDAMTAEISIVLTPRPAAPVPPPTTPRTPRPPRDPSEGTTTPPTTTTTPPPEEHHDAPPPEEHHDAPPPEEHHEAPPPAPEEAPPDNPF